MTEADSVLVERDGPVTIVSINRPHCRNAVDGATARKLFDAFLAFDADAEASVAVFTGTGGYFCAGADLKAVASGDPNKKRESGGHDSIAPMGPSRLRLSKPVIAAVEGFAVAGGMELALWADMRVVAEDATFGVFCRRFGVPLIDLGPIRLPRLIGHSQAIDYYVGILGFTLAEDIYIAAQDKRWVTVAPPGSTETRLLLARAAGKEQSARIGNQTGGRIFLFLHTDDFWRDFHSYKAKGVVFVREPMAESYGTVAVFKDLYGNLWDLLQPNADAHSDSK